MGMGDYLDERHYERECERRGWRRPLPLLTEVSLPGLPVEETAEGPEATPDNEATKAKAPPSKPGK